MDGIRAVGGVGCGQELTPEEKAEVAKLSARDREVRTHEAQHAAAAGDMAAGIQYEYEMGPDGKMYAVGGKTQIVMSSTGSPEETLAKARQLREAATAVDDPSGQDLTVAAKASAMEAQAQQKIAEKHSRETCQGDNAKTPPSLRGFDRLA